MIQLAIAVEHSAIKIELAPYANDSFFFVDDDELDFLLNLLDAIRAYINDYHIQKIEFDRDILIDESRKYGIQNTFNNLK